MPWSSVGAPLFCSSFLGVKSLPQGGPGICPRSLVGRLVWLTDLVTLGVAALKNTWEKVASSLEESSVLEEGGAPRVTDAGILGVGLLKAWLEVSSATHEKSSWTSVVMLMWPLTPEGCSTVRWVGEVGAKVL